MSDIEVSEPFKVKSLQWVREQVEYWRDEVKEVAEEAASVLSVAERSRTGRVVVLSIRAFIDSYEDLEDIVQNFKGDGDYVATNIDGDDVVAFSSEQATDAFLEWCEKNAEWD